MLTIRPNFFFCVQPSSFYTITANRGSSWQMG